MRVNELRVFFINAPSENLKKIPAGSTGPIITQRLNLLHHLESLWRQIHLVRMDSQSGSSTTTESFNNNNNNSMKSDLKSLSRLTHLQKGRRWTGGTRRDSELVPPPPHLPAPVWTSRSERTQKQDFIIRTWRQRSGFKQLFNVRAVSACEDLWLWKGNTCVIKISLYVKSCCRQLRGQFISQPQILSCCFPSCC